MAIAEAQLDTWSQQGKTGQFTDTYKSVSANLLDTSAPHPVKNCEVHLQGSYGNNTNVWADSDVDIVLKHTGAFYYDITGMSQGEQQAFNGVFSKNAEFGYMQFKADAEGFIKRLYNGVATGKKAVFIPGNNNRRNADVLLCQEFRRYFSYELRVHGCHYGVAFYVNGSRIENFPKQHSENCTAKHQATNQNFKRMVRVFKNMRNRMIEEGLLSAESEGAAFWQTRPRSSHPRPGQQAEMAYSPVSQSRCRRYSASTPGPRDKISSDQ